MIGESLKTACLSIRLDNAAFVIFAWTQYSHTFCHKRKERLIYKYVKIGFHLFFMSNLKPGPRKFGNVKKLFFFFYLTFTKPGWTLKL